MAANVRQLTVFLFPGLTGQIEELFPLYATVLDFVSVIPVSYPHWVQLHADAMGSPEFVDFCKEQIEQQASSGPICLVGYSFGGLVALAVAAALVDAGRSDLQLGLVDTSLVLDFRYPPRTLRTAIKSIVQMVQTKTVVFKTGIRAAQVLLQVDKGWMWLAAMHIYQHWPSVWPMRQLGAAFQLSFQEIILRELMEWLTKSPLRFCFRATLFRCIDQHPGAADDLGWGRLLGHLRVIPFPGGHCTWMNEPNLVSETFSDWVTSALIPALDEANSPGDSHLA